MGETISLLIGMRNVFSIFGFMHLNLGGYDSLLANWHVKCPLQYLESGT